MIRGRHRGLPVAIDRAVMLPMEFNRSVDVEEEDGGEGDNLPVSSGHEKPSEDTEWRQRKNARRRSTEEMSVTDGRKSAANADRETAFGY